MTDMKISQFNVSMTLNNSDLFTFVVNNTNKNITFSDFKSELGVTGTLAQEGDPLAAPILDIVGTDYKIRNAESGSGVLTSLSPSNGVKFDWNVAQDATGVSLTNGLLTASTPAIASLVAGQGLSITKNGNAITFDNTVDPATGLSNRIVVTQASDLQGTIDSSKEYFIDGIVNLTGSNVQIQVPVGGISITGYNPEVSKLICTDTNYTMFTSAGNNGNFIGKDFAIEVSGTNSKVFDISDSTSQAVFEITGVNFNNCTSLGTIESYQLGLETVTGRFGGTPELTLAGAWPGGYFIDTSLTKDLADGSYSIYSAGANFTMASRFRTNQNVNLPASASFIDFSSANFTNPSTLQVDGAIVTRNGVFNATDANLTPNISASNLACAWSGNNGMPNTFVGGTLAIATEAQTVISAINTFVDLNAGSWTSVDLQHFDSPAPGQLRHLGNTPREFKIIADFLLDSSPTNDVTLRVLKWDQSAAAFSIVVDQRREVNSLTGGRDVAFFNLNFNLTLDANDFVKFQVANLSATSNITAEQDSYYILEAR